MAIRPAGAAAARRDGANCLRRKPLVWACGKLRGRCRRFRRRPRAAIAAAGDAAAPSLRSQPGRDAGKIGFSSHPRCS